MLNLIFLAIIALLCCAILYAHRKHSDALEELKGVVASMRREFNLLRKKEDGT